MTRIDEALAKLKADIEETEINDPLGEPISPTALPYAKLCLRAMEALMKRREAIEHIEQCKSCVLEIWGTATPWPEADELSDNILTDFADAILGLEGKEQGAMR